MERRPNRPPEHLPSEKEILPPVAVTVHKDGKRREFTEEQLQKDDEAWIIAVTRPTGYELGS